MGLFLNSSRHVEAAEGEQVASLRRILHALLLMVGLSDQNQAGDRLLLVEKL